MFKYTQDRYSLLNNLPVLKLDYGIGLFKSSEQNDYSFAPKHSHLEMQYSPACKQIIKDRERLLTQYKVAHIGRRRKVEHKGKPVINNIQCNFDGYAYTLPMGLKHMLNQQRIVPIILIPNEINTLNDPSCKEYRKLDILNLKEMILNIQVLSKVEEYYYNNCFLQHTADLLHIKPLGKLTHK